MLLLLATALAPVPVWSQEPSHAAAQVFLAQGELAFEDGDFDRAEKLFTAAAGEDPADGTPLCWLGLSSLALGQYDEAEKQLDLCLAKHPPEALRARAVADRERARSLRAQGAGAGRSVVTAPEVPLGPVDLRQAPPRWDVTVDLAVGKDSNPAFLPADVTGSPPLSTGPRAAESDSVAVLGVQVAQHPLFDRGGWTLGWSLAGQRSSYRELSPLDLTSARGVVSLAWGADTAGWLGGPLGTLRVPSRPQRVVAVVQAGGSTFWLGSERYLRTGEAGAAVLFRESPAWTTRMEVEVLDRRFALDADGPFRRSGPELAAAVSQSLFLYRVGGLLRLGVREGERGGGRAFDGSFAEIFAELAIPLPGRWSLAVQASHRDDRFAHVESSLNDSGPTRSDRTWRLAGSLAFPLRPDLIWTAAGLWTDRESNVDFPPGYPLFAYRRALLTTGLRWTL